MFSRLIESFFELIIPFMAKMLVKQTDKEKIVEENYKKTLKIVARLTKKPVIFAMIGLVGSGKSSVARKIASQIGANIIEGDTIRSELKKVGEKYDNTRIIAENIAISIIMNGGNIVLDSDFIDSKKRAVIANKAKKARVKLIFIRVTCDLDTSIGRIISASNTDSADNFFGGATTLWKNEKKGSVVKIREIIRRIPQHYRWENKAGGKWVAKKISVEVGATIDTTDEDKWPEQVLKLASKLK